ncbi:MAG TPA: thioredoxin domain-containing protein, partial [Burkholderiales bacterium]|nr:thioredoxin domain-containing protein [Burkholderiales bacterium]
MPNRLAQETSPYLQQHAGNPVDWYPWGEEALARSRAEDKPILLSIGYSACHWCHVMAHESFEDPQIAALMNRDFVNVKVDREERPDLDHIYQTAHQMLAQGAGGWPLTMFLSPEGTPFLGGTYFPKTARYGRPGFAELLQKVARLWRERRKDIRAQDEQVRLAFSSLNPAADGPATLDAGPLQSALANLRASFDARFGGFGAAPK